VIRHSIIGKRLAVEFGEDGANVALRLKAIVDENNQALHQDRREDRKSLHRDKEICR